MIVTVSGKRFFLLDDPIHDINRVYLVLYYRRVVRLYNKWGNDKVTCMASTVQFII